MGGINHAPCSRYLNLSTRVSRSLSLAHAELELANVALEDVLLGELVNKKGSLVLVLSRLNASNGQLEEMLSHMGALKAGLSKLPCWSR